MKIVRGNRSMQVLRGLGFWLSYSLGGYGVEARPTATGEEMTALGSGTPLAEGGAIQQGSARVDKVPWPALGHRCATPRWVARGLDPVMARCLSAL